MQPSTLIYFQKEAAIMNRIIAISLLSFGFSLPSWAFDSGSTGADGAFLPSIDTNVQLPEDGILNYTDMIIPSGITVRFLPNANNTPVTLLVSGNADIQGTIDISGENAADSHGAGNGAVADDGLPGAGGPGGYRGGRGGLPNVDNAQFGPRVAESGIGPGGGPAGGTQTSNNFPCDGYGAAFAVAGTDECTSSGSFDDNIPAASAYGNAELLPLIGGSGGSGGPGGEFLMGTGGGGGGGAIVLAVSGTLTLDGTISATGGNGGIAIVPDSSPRFGHGGAGSGGAIRIVATTISGSGVITATGGIGGGFLRTLTDNSFSQRGGSGSTGRTRIEAENSTFIGPVSPATTITLPNNVFLSSLPVLRIASVAGIPAPASPTGVADIVLPIDEPNPVDVVLEASNVPLGNIISVRVSPANGQTVIATSGALNGSFENSTAIAQVNLNEGPSTFLATLRFTIAEDELFTFNNFTNGEPVVEMELLASLTGETQTILITESGRRVNVDGHLNTAD